jgi:uncharacterized membrane-anchored protein
MKPLPRWWPQAVAEKLLPPQVQDALDDDHPSWLVLLLGFFGAYLILIPILGILLLAFGGRILQQPAAQIAALALAAAAILFLCAKKSLFVAQLGLNMALAAQTLWLIGWEAQLNWPALLGLLALQIVISLGCKLVWVQRILGVLVAWTALTLPLSTGAAGLNIDTLLVTWPNNVLLLSLLWMTWVMQEKRFLGQTWALPVSALADGIGAGILLALAGRSTALAVMLGAGASGSAEVADAGLQTLWSWSWLATIQAVLVLFSGFGLWWHWRPDARSGALLLPVYGGLLAFCPVVPHLGVLALIGTLAAAHGKKRLLWLALAILLVSLGNFYYALAWPLTDKAVLLAVMGALLASALFVLRRPRSGITAPAAPQVKWLLGALALATLLPLWVVRGDVAQKEEIIAHGQKIYLPLVPRDPRSLLQGDYMALRFDLPAALRDELGKRQRNAPGLRQALAVAELDAQGVARLLRLAVQGETPAGHELLLPLQQLKGEWVLVTDAYFFPEGQGQTLARARFGEFRVLPDGRALLVGLADDGLHAMQPAAKRDANGNRADTIE